MKKGKIIGKRQIVLAALVLCLAAAVWLNMRFASFENPETAGAGSDLGDTEYMSQGGNLGEAIQTSTGADYIASARLERNNNREKLAGEFAALLKDAGVSEDAKAEALQKATDIALRAEKEVAAEVLIKAKGFSDALVIIADESVTVIVPAETLLTSETLQIQDAVLSQMSIELEKIKIITVK